MKREQWKRILRRPEDAQAAARVVSQFQCEYAVELTARLYQPPHSDPQRNTFWMWCEDIAAALRDGGTVTNRDEIHDFVLGKIYGWRESEITGQKFPRHSLTKPHRKGKQEMAEILTQMQALAHEWGVPLRQPEEMRSAA